MSHITLNIVADNASDLASIIAGLQEQFGGAPIAAEPAKAPRQKREPASAAAADPTPPSPAATATEAGTSTQTPSSESASAATTETAIAYDDVKKAVLALAAAKGRDAVVTVLEKYGVDHASKIDAAQWPAAHADLTAALAG